MRNLTPYTGIEHAGMQIDDELETVIENECSELISAWDDVSGAGLDSKQEYVARMEEVRFIKEMKL